MIICDICNTPYSYTRSRADTKTTCGSCRRKISRYSVKKKLVDYLGGSCQQCGYSKSLAALTFHHRNPEIKSFTISGNHTRSWSVLKQELDKCDLLCFNCHLELHHDYEEFIQDHL